ncbi:Serpin domain containing protein [Trichuris trichiura]|uniref:Serpin domain containing protein n=1 Tax=Trichuris trichiura TaxID=36087 RepID=A0A077ZLD1_TRITR|nr:Serpin domain containing protein [Trichuris trichiura]
MSLDVITADFALRTYHEAAVANHSFFMSPFSILIALGMTYVGSSGNTKSQMKSKLFESSLRDGQINSLMSSAIKSFNYSNTKDGYELYIANRLFGQSELQVLPRFRKRIQKHYSADIELLNFKKSSKARQHINDWVEKKTEGKIKDLIPKGAINSLTRLVLTNAIYFKAGWKTPFESALTKTSTFYVKQGEEKTVEMMRMKKEFPYSETDELQILGIPYVTEKLLMYFVLPKERFGLKNMMRKLNATKLLDLFDSATERKVEVDIPKFKLEHDLKLKEVLRRLGLTDMFDPGLANFSKITGRRDLYVSEAFHKAFIEVNEKGSEAAAATAVVMALGSSLVRIPPPKFTADHPFLFAIVDRSNGIILFIGDYYGVSA